MARYAAFLRAINVGGRVVKMETLRAQLAGAGLVDVETFIASGNVLFHSPAKSAALLETRIEAVLREALGYHVATFVRTMSELAAIGERRPFNGSDVAGVSLHIGLLKAAPGPANRRALMALRSDVNEFVVDGRELYWQLHGRFSDAGVTGAQIEKTLGVEATLRNATTIRKLAARALMG
jgi:uncharacterized protein (DUF1697 family)